ncbi:MAG: hypothetical protein JWP13_758 [Candidatus Saccharibacteria bacterium]|nr:hypothetical protein [Candidatus Saccharibacteria bacterium]
MSGPNDGIMRLLQTARHAAMATVNNDGSPHNTPFLFLHDEGFAKIFWSSHLESQHSQNILRTGQIFVVVYDVLEKGGVYFRANNGRILEDEELKLALDTHNAIRAQDNKRALTASYYTGDAPQKMWGADISEIWINDVLRDDSGLVVKDFRQKVSPEDLIS